MNELTPELFVDLGLLGLSGVLLYVIGEKGLTIKDFIVTVRERAKRYDY
jgi:hypothetical protein